LKYTQLFIKATSAKKIKKRFTEKQEEEFNTILQNISRKTIKPKWKVD